jgi:hypothetical protein
LAKASAKVLPSHETTKESPKKIRTFFSHTPFLETKHGRKRRKMRQQNKNRRQIPRSPPLPKKPDLSLKNLTTPAPFSPRKHLSSPKKHFISSEKHLRS